MDRSKSPARLPLLLAGLLGLLPAGGGCSGSTKPPEVVAPDQVRQQSVQRSMKDYIAKKAGAR